MLFVITISAFSQFSPQNPVSWKYRFEDNGNGIYELFFSGDIKKPWHVYAIKLEQEGPIPLNILKIDEIRLEGDD